MSGGERTRETALRSDGLEASTRGTHSVSVYTLRRWWSDEALLLRRPRSADDQSHDCCRCLRGAVSSGDKGSRGGNSNGGGVGPPSWKGGGSRTEVKERRGRPPLLDSVSQGARCGDSGEGEGSGGGRARRASTPERAEAPLVRLLLRLRAAEEKELFSRESIKDSADSVDSFRIRDCRRNGRGRDI